MSKGRHSLGEIMGKRGAELVGSKKLSFDDLPDLLGEGLPTIKFDRVGRFRLMNALKGRFGINYRNIPGIMDIVKDFDERVEFEDRVQKISQIKYERKAK